ncbi:MAG TPA: MerR family transcriptional regulator [Balneolales bacterium]|nr:MerR family transcriptional regulator [Balneolales bacterium]
MSEIILKIGQLARRTGLTVRTLRYYDEIGLLNPSKRMDSGYRLYGVEEIERLHNILALRQLGFSLEEMQSCLDNPEYSLDNIIIRQMKQVREDIELKKQLYARLKTMADHIRFAEKISVDELIQTMKVMTMHEKYFNEDQMEELKQRRNNIGQVRMQQAQKDWQELINDVRIEMKNGADPIDKKVQELAKRWKKLIEEFTGGDSQIQNSLRDMYTSEGPEKASQGFVDAEVMSFMSRALSSTK